MKPVTIFALLAAAFTAHAFVPAARCVAPARLTQHTSVRDAQCTPAPLRALSQAENPSHAQVARLSPPRMMSDEAPTSGRRGISVDQDGKSNIWSIEPTMRVEEADNSKNLAIVGVTAVFAVVAIAAAFPFIPDPNI